MSENSKLCMAAQQTPSALPPGAITMEATTPLAGLLKWCILAPLYNQDSELYSQLHLSLLNSLLEIPQVNPPRAITVQQLSAPVGHICRYMLTMNSRNRKAFTENNIGAKELNICLDRYAQAVQVSLYMNCVYGNIEDLMNQLCQLPHNRLLNIVILTHKQNK